MTTAAEHLNYADGLGDTCGACRAVFVRGVAWMCAEFDVALRQKPSGAVMKCAECRKIDRRQEEND